jgi:hypothetical protein
MAGAERGGICGFLIADGTPGRTDRVVAKRRTVSAFATVLDIGARGVHCGTGAA